MQTGPDEEEMTAASARERQERKIALSHSLTCAEHALACEAFTIGRTLECAGIDFDPLTFIAFRLVDGSTGMDVDPVELLELLLSEGFLERSVGMAKDFLEDAA
jgi:hypothetical protein